MTARDEHEGIVKYHVQHVSRKLRAQPGFDDLIRWRGELFAHKLIGVDDAGIGYGNLSVRLYASPRFLITGSQTSGLAQVDRRHFSEVQVVDLERNFLRCAGETSASSEAMTHAALYQASASIRGVVHVHARSIWQRCKNVLPTTRDDIAYGTPEMAHAMIRLHKSGAIGNEGVVIMGGHQDGVIGFGPSLARAVERILSMAQATEAR